MNCPTCGSDETRKYKMIYSEGAYTSETRLEGRTAQTSGMSDLAKQCSPPRKQSPTATFLVGLFLLFVLDWIAEAVFNTQSSDTAANLVAAGFLLGIPVVIYLAIGASRFNRKEFPRLLAAWEGQWMCMRCGASFAEGA